MGHKSLNRVPDASTKREADVADQRSSSRRKLLRTLAAGGGVAVAFKSLPETWSQPVVDTVLLPVHAQTTGPALFGSGQGGSLVFGGSDPGDAVRSYVFDDAVPAPSPLLNWIPSAHAQGGPPPGRPGPGGIISAVFHASAINNGAGGFSVRVLLRVIFPGGGEEEDASAEGASETLLNGLVGAAYAQGGPPQCVTDLTWNFDLEPMPGADFGAPDGYRTNWSTPRKGDLACGNPRSLGDFEARFRLREITSRQAFMQVDYGGERQLRFGMKDSGSIPSANCEGMPCAVEEEDD